MLLAGKVAVVSGIGPGMGRDVALALAGEGAALVLGARRDRYLISVAAEIEAAGGRALWRRTDVTDEADCRHLADAAAQAFGGVDILVNNAAHGGTEGRLADASTAELRPPLEVNVLGTLQMTRAVVPHMVSRGEGRIIMIATNVADVVVDGFGGYGLSKAALIHATGHLANELGPLGIRVNSVLPGAIWGRALARYFDDVAGRRGISADEVLAEQASTTALGYLPPSSEIAGTVVYLASDLARPATGQSIRVDCGQWLAFSGPA